MKTRSLWMKRAAMLFVVWACSLAATNAFAVSQSQFKASLTGVAVVDDHRIFYTNSALAKVVFSSPQTSLVVPYGKTLLLRMSYDFPSGYGAYLWTRDAKWSVAHGGIPGTNPSELFTGKGTAYGFITLHDNSWDSTLESVAIKTGADLTGNGNQTEWTISTVPVNVQFKGSVVASLALGAGSRSFTAEAANSKELGVTANVAWTAKSSASWLAVKTASGSGNGKIVYNVAANTWTGARSGTITVTGGGLTRTFTVTQSGKTGEGTAASLALGAASRSFTADAASSKELGVTANVAWTAKSSASWLAVKTASGSGNGKIVYNVAANTWTGARSGTITVTGGGLTRTFTVTQSGKTWGGTTASLALGAASRSFTPDAANNKELGVTANVAWTAKSSVSWLAVKTASGSGNGTIVYNVAKNTGSSTRTAILTVTGDGLTRTFTVTQSGNLAASCVQLWAGGPYWSDRNIGADKPWDYGFFFWWGDTVGYRRENETWVASDGSRSNFSFHPTNAPTEDMSYSALRSTGWITAEGVLAPAHDAAQVHWGGGWRMPTDLELSGLTNRCDWAWTEMNGVKGLVIRGRGTYAGNSIFIPAAGTGSTTVWRWAGFDGTILSSVPCPDDPIRMREFYFDFLDFYGMRNGCRYYGVSIRPVQGVAQGGAVATLTLAASFRSFTADAASSKELGVTANVAWTAKSSASWLAVKMANGSGNGKIVYNVAANTGAGARSGTITVTGGGLTRTFTVTQSGKPGGGTTTAPLTLGTSERSFTSGAANSKELTVTANVPWTARSSASWLVLKTASGSGNGKIVYNVAKNPESAPRTAIITVEGGGLAVAFAVTQKGTQGGVAGGGTGGSSGGGSGGGIAGSANDSKLALPKSYREFDSGAYSGKEFKVQATVEWTATSSESWIKLAKASGNGVGVVEYDVSKNQGAEREAIITVEGGGETVEYRIVQSAVKRSNKKFALCVGVDDASTKPCCANDAKYFADNLAKRGGGWSSIKKFPDNEAKKNAIRSYIANIAEQTIPGDAFVYFHSSHGGRSSDGHCFLNTADYSYRDTDFAEDLKKFPKGVKIVVILNACHSGGMIWKKKAGMGFPFAERVSDIIDAEHSQTAARGRRGFVNKISSSEIGWVTAAHAGEQATGPGYYDTGDWMFGDKTGSVEGGIFSTAFTWGWWYGEADMLNGADKDMKFDAYEGYLFAHQYCKENKNYTPECYNKEVLKSVELGSCGRANLKFSKPSGWPAAVFVTTSEKKTDKQTKFTASGSVFPCVRAAWYNASQNEVTETGTAARPYAIQWKLSGPKSISPFNCQNNSLMPKTYATAHMYCVIETFPGFYSAPSVAGKYAVTITLDSENQVTEGNENDNTATVTFTVVSGKGTKTGGPEGLKKRNEMTKPEGTEAQTPSARDAATNATDSQSDDWVAVTTSDGEDGGVLLDRDEGTGWGPVGEGGGWVVLSYSEPIDVKGVLVKGENLPEEGVRVLLSEDADDWREATEGRAQYVWVAVPEDAAGATLTEIEVEEK